MLLRVGLGDTAPDPQWYREYLEYLGPFLMTGALVFGTYYSRSPPARRPWGWRSTSSCFPNCAPTSGKTLPGLAWGSGLGSAIAPWAWWRSVSACVPGGCLEHLGEGDLFLGRAVSAPARRPHAVHHPAGVCGAVLVLRVETWDFVRNWTARPLCGNRAAAAVSGVAWPCVAVFWRADRRARWAVHMGWIWGAVGIGCWYWRQAADPHWTWPLLLAGLWVQGLYWILPLRSGTAVAVGAPIADRTDPAGVKDGQSVGAAGQWLPWSSVGPGPNAVAAGCLWRPKACGMACKDENALLAWLLFFVLWF